MSFCLMPGLSSAYWHIRRRSSSVKVRRGVLPPVVVCRTRDWGLADTAEDGVVVAGVGMVGVEYVDWAVNMLGHCGTINGCSGCNC